jgi:glucose-1-phosphate cytidylyltransferase
MKAFILAGGRGTRLSEQTVVRPKPMVEVGGQPLLWHIMQGYARQGVHEFVVALGYKGDIIKRYFLDLHTLSSDLEIDLGTGVCKLKERQHSEWKVHLLDTGLDTQTGGRLRRLSQFVDGTFMLTYGDGVSDVNLKALMEFHRKHGKLATVTAVRPPPRFGGLTLQGEKVARFLEKQQISEGWINGGFFVLEPKVLDYISGDDMAFEQDPLARLAQEGQLMAYRHESFWQCVDTQRDLDTLNDLWRGGRVPWMPC